MLHFLLISIETSFASLKMFPEVSEVCVVYAEGQDLHTQGSKL